MHTARRPSTSLLQFHTQFHAQFLHPLELLLNCWPVATPQGDFPHYGTHLHKSYPAMLYASDLIRWLQRKRYQYEVTFSLYMLTPTEKIIFSTFPLPITECMLRAPSSMSFSKGSLLLSPPLDLGPYFTIIVSWPSKRSLTFFCRHIPPSLHLYDHHRRIIIPP